VRVTCGNCGETGKLRPAAGETLASLRETLVCYRCGILDAQVERRDEVRPESGILQSAAAVLVGAIAAFVVIGGVYLVLKVGRDLPAVLLVCAVSLLVCFALYTLFKSIFEHADWGFVLVVSGGAVAGAVLLVAISLPLGIVGRLFVDAFAYEYADSVRNSPRGGYYEREDAATSSTRFMNVYERPEDREKK
jgi:hypothetical protein